MNLVTVDVTVLSRGGNPVTTLTADDFALLVDGVPRPIMSMRLVRGVGKGREAGAGAARRPGAACLGHRRRAAGSCSSSTAITSPRARASRCSRRPRGSSTACLPMTASPSGSSRTPVDRCASTTTARPSRRGSGWRSGLTRRRTAPGSSGATRAIKADAGDKEVLRAIITRECYLQVQTCPAEVRAQVTQTASEARHRAEATLTNLGHLVDALGAVDGPKHVVLVTGGPVATFDNSAVIAGLGSRAAQARVTIHALQVAQPFLPGPHRRDAGHAGGHRPVGVGGLPFAGSTGGLAITPTSGEIGFGRLERELSASYVLVFETQPADRDGRVHRIS